MGRFLLYAVLGPVLAGGLMYLMALSGGIDPLAPEVRTIALVSLLAALYVGLRLAMVVRSYQRQREANKRAAGDTSGDREDADAPRRNAFSRWGRDSRLDARMEARRERLRRAKAQGRLKDDAD